MDKTKNKDNVISAFAFNTGKEIEKMINERLSHLESENIKLKAYILNWYIKTHDEDFAEFFGVFKDVGYSK